MPLEPRPYLLVNRIKPYAWGARGADAFIPRLLGIEPQADTPYAELWMGTHPNAPSEVIVGDARIPLPQLTAQYPREILGERVAEQFSGRLPFLLKVLSTAESLSIQAHPTKKQARRLHTRDPEHYPDDNHKPELAVALDSLTAVMGFKPFPGILEALEGYPELADFVGREIADRAKSAEQASVQQQKALLQELYTTFTQRAVAHGEELVAATGQLAERLESATDGLCEEEQLFLELREKYSGADTGLFTLFLLNLVHLEEGQGVFIDAGIPHAYLKGNIVECMANSDNVVRAGLTPKFKDVETLVDILTYEMGPPPIIEGNAGAARVTYQTPVPEFQVSRLRMELGQRWVELTNDAPQILLVTQGDVHIGWEGGEEAFWRGQSVLIPASLKVFRLLAETPVELFKVTVPSQD
jgi:mannose-6-phosphate isomerase